MPESRDRLPRPVEISAFFTRRRSEGVGILTDNQEAGESVMRSPILRTMGSPALRTPLRTGLTRGNASMRGRLGALRTSGSRLDRNPYGSPPFYLDTRTPAGSSRRGTGRPMNSILPSWYPRTPLRDITSVVAAIERRRARLTENEGQQHHHFPDQRMIYPAESVYNFSPLQTLKIKPSLVGSVPKILHGITKQDSELDLLTPQKKLLKSIDTVEKIVMEELQKLKRTPSAKKAEREKKVRTLMAMR